MNQQSIDFDAVNAPKTDRPRLNKQSLAIFKLLQSGPVENKNLQQIAFNYTARISDIRKAGWDVKCKRLSGGRSLYTLEGRSE